MLMQGSWGWLKLAVLTVMLPAAIDSLDLAVRNDLQRHHDPRLDPIMQAATNLGRKDILFGLLLGVAILDPAAGPATARLAVTSLVGTNLVVEGLKWAFDRPRPHGVHQRSNASFPSGHAASAFALAVVFARRWKRAAVAFWLLASIVAFSRLYLDRHYLTDVAVAVAIGIACASLLTRWRLATTWGLPQRKPT
jgi:undecaprenyl-diphosphatase